MTDPISVVALAAAVGGMAGKVAERSWEAAAKWLEEKFGSHSETVREQALLNSAYFVDRLAARVRALEERDKVVEEQLTATQRQPQFSSLLQQTVLEAAQTSDASKHDLLAGLVASRLAAEPETTLALASSLAATAIAKATRRQLRLLGIMTFVDEIRPIHLESSAHFRKWLGTVLPVFSDVEFQRIDARHLAALTCVTVDPTSARDLTTALNMKAILLLHELVEFGDVKGFLELQHNWNEVLCTVQLTSVGSIVGGLVLSQLTSFDFPQPEWE